MLTKDKKKARPGRGAVLGESVGTQQGPGGQVNSEGGPVLGWTGEWSRAWAQHHPMVEIQGSGPGFQHPKFSGSYRVLDAL